MGCLAFKVTRESLSSCESAETQEVGCDLWRIKSGSKGNLYDALDNDVGIL